MQIVEEIHAIISKAEDPETNRGKEGEGLN